MKRLSVVVLLVALATLTVGAQGTVIPYPRIQFFDSNGDPLAGGKLHVFQCGTTTPQNVYSDVALSTPLPNPVILDAAGRPQTGVGAAAVVYLDPAICYKFRLDNSADVTQWTADNVAATETGIALSHDLLPDTHDTYDIGSTGTRWQDLFLSGSITASGSATIGGTATITGGQITFPATQAASAGVNVLDDYEEGTWTPTITFATPGNLVVVYAIQVGTYTKVGDLVRASFTIQTSTFTHTTASGNFSINGLPFASANVGNNLHVGALSWQGITKASYTNVVTRQAVGATQLLLFASGSGQAAAAIASGDMPTGGTVLLVGTHVYQAGT